MANFDAKDVMTLRRKSGLGLMECKAALQEVNGVMAAAEDNLRKKGLSNMDGRADREACEGCVSVALSADGTHCAIVEVNTETDFTAKNDRFVELASDLAKMALEQPAGAVQKTDAMQTRIDDVRLATKENVQWKRGQVFTQGHLGYYVHHDRKTGVVVELSADVDDESLRKLCLHVTSVVPEPLGITADDVPQEPLSKEREIAFAQASASGKPANIAEKMVEGKIRKYLDGVVLLRQPLVMDDSVSVQSLLPEGVLIRNFVKYRVGG